jgi:acyl carrier protein
MDDVRARLTKVFRKVFDDDDLEITDATTAADVNGWDSMAQINLIVGIEKALGVKFTAAELAGLKTEGNSVGGLVQMLEAKLAAR